MDWNFDNEVSALENLYGLIFYFMARETVDTFGKEGEEAVKRAMAKYGAYRGGLLRKEHEKKGIEINVKDLFEHYDLPQDPRTNRKRFVLNETEKISEYYSCQFAEMWQMLDGTQEGSPIGALYCEAFHPAMYAGYDPRISLNLPKTFTYGDDCCRFEVKMQLDPEKETPAQKEKDEKTNP